MNAGANGNVQLLLAPFQDGVTAGAILLAMGLGLSLPKLLMEGLFPTLAGIQARSRTVERAQTKSGDQYEKRSRLVN